MRAIFIHDTESRETHQLTDGTVDAVAPVWDESGKYLYFLASADYGLNTGWLDMVLTVVTTSVQGANFAPVVFAAPVVNIDYVESEDE